MLGLTTLRHHRREVLALHAVIARLRDERDKARDERNAFKAAARTASRQYTEADHERQQLIEGGPAKQAGHPDEELLRARGQARALEEQLADLQTINERCICGGSA